MLKNKLYILLSLQLACSCVKDTINTPQPEPIPPETPKVSFVFVNRNGFRNDSTRHGVNDTVLGGVCLDSKFYDKSTNNTSLISTCFDRNYPPNNYPLKDSIAFTSSKSSINSKYAYQIEIIWNCPKYPYTTKLLRYTSRGWPNGDTIKFVKDTIIKFIWPNDSNSSRFIKTYQWP